MNSVLNGQRILVTRPQAQAETLCKMISDKGGEAIRLPAIEIVASSRSPQLAEQLSAKPPYDIGVFISRNAVIWTLKLLDQDIKKLHALKLLAIGSGTANELSHAGIENVDHAEGNADSETLLQLPVLQEASVRKKRILIFRGEGGRELLSDTLRERGASVEYVDVYRRVCPDYSAETINNVFSPRPPDVVIVTSSEGLKNLLGMISSNYRKLLLTSRLVTFGKRLASLAQDSGFEKSPVVADSATDEGLLAAILKIAGAETR